MHENSYFKQIVITTAIAAMDYYLIFLKRLNQTFFKINSRIYVNKIFIQLIITCVCFAAPCSIVSSLFVAFGRHFVEVGEQKKKKNLKRSTHFGITSIIFPPNERHLLFACFCSLCVVTFSMEIRHLWEMAWWKFITIERFWLEFEIFISNKFSIQEIQLVLFVQPKRWTQLIRQ